MDSAEPSSASLKLFPDEIESLSNEKKGNDSLQTNGSPSPKKINVNIDYKIRNVAGILLILSVFFLFPILIVNSINSKISIKETENQDDVLGVNITYTDDKERSEDVKVKTTLKIPLINKEIDTSNLKIDNIEGGIRENPQIATVGGVILSFVAGILGIALVKNIISSKAKGEKISSQDPPIMGKVS